MGTYARFDQATGETVINVEVWEVAPAGLVEIDSISPEPGIGWTFIGGGWGAPAPNIPATNQNTILANLDAHQAQIAAFIAANPAGAVLTAAQTLVVAKMLNALFLVV